MSMSVPALIPAGQTTSQPSNFNLIISLSLYGESFLVYIKPYQQRIAYSQAFRPANLSSAIAADCLTIGIRMTSLKSA